jgi:hypothetical protein
VIDKTLDTADLYYRILDSNRDGASKVAMTALLDLPAELPIGYLTTYCTSLDDGTTVTATSGVITAAGAIQWLVEGRLDAAEVIDVLIEQDLIRPYDGEEVQQ